MSLNVTMRLDQDLIWSATEEDELLLGQMLIEMARLKSVGLDE
jgi:hypothetical protein